MSTKNIARPARTARPPRTIANSARTKLTFARLPRDYAGLCRILLPRPVRDDADFANSSEVVMAMAGHDAEFSADQHDYFNLLGDLLLDYEEQHVEKWLARTALQRLKYLLGEHGLNGADLARILGLSRNLGPAILRGEREITAAHARALGKYFHMDPGAFIA